MAERAHGTVVALFFCANYDCSLVQFSLNAKRAGSQAKNTQWLPPWRLRNLKERLSVFRLPGKRGSVNSKLLIETN